MDITINEKRLLDFAVSYLGSMYGNLKIHRKQKFEQNNFQKVYIDFFIKNNEIIFSSTNDDFFKVIVSNEVAEQLESMFGINFPYIKKVTLRWLLEHYDITPEKFYFGSFTHIDLTDDEV